MSMDTAHFRAELEQARERLLRTIENHDIGSASLTEQTGELLSGSNDNHLADTATETYERELDEGLEEDAREQLHQVEKALSGRRPFTLAIGTRVPSFSTALSSSSNSCVRPRTLTSA